jgi:hypothetical protein
MSELMTTTYSMWSAFRNCRKACEWRYIRELVPLERDHTLAFGTLIHQCLETWHRDRDLAKVLDLIDRARPNHAGDDRERADWHLARAMMEGYAARYPTEDFEVVALERTFEGPIINPATGAQSRSFVLAGKVDGIVRNAEGHWLLEHKTAATIDSSYLERLWGDFQIVLYSHYVEQVLGIPVAGVLYNILGKARLQQGRGETEAEFEARRAELIARSKSGKTSAKRKDPESDEDFQKRLAEKYADPAVFHREMLYISRDQFEVLESELWELTQAFLEARRRGVYYQNPGFCFHYNRPCAYYPLCRGNGAQHLIDNFYEHLPPHEELRVGAAAEEAPAF